MKKTDGIVGPELAVQGVSANQVADCYGSGPGSGQWIAPLGCLAGVFGESLFLALGVFRVARNVVRMNVADWREEED